MHYQTNYPYATTSQQSGAISHLREEQRRRQQEYSQALAQQVAQREQQKQLEREIDRQYARRNNSFQNSSQQYHSFGQRRQENFESAERNMLDGFGRNNPQNSRTGFARGQPQLHHRLPGGPVQGYLPPAFPPTRESYGGQTNDHQLNNQRIRNQSVPSDFGLPEYQSHHQPIQQGHWNQQPPAHAELGPGPAGAHVFPPVPHVRNGWAEQNMQPNTTANSQFFPDQGFIEQSQVPVVNAGFVSPQQKQQQHFQMQHAQPEQPGRSNAQHGGRRQRTDIRDGGRGDSEEAERLRRKVQQQQEMQLALERQIEEKRQQKLEAKRRQEEEDRQELERFEEDQRRQRAEQERIEEEKRRKAVLEQQKAEQAAAAVAAANQQAKLHQQQKLHAQASQAQLQHQHPVHTQPHQQQQQFQYQSPPQQPEHFGNAPSPSRLKNPFTNSRAHLFEDPPPQVSPQRGASIPGHSNQKASPIRRPQNHNSVYPQQSNAVRHSIDPTELRREYDDMREELRKQKQLVDQLCQAQAQIQHQQQLSPLRSESRTIPTLMDLDKLRNELRHELDYREQLHRQELASLTRGQQQEKRPERSPRLVVKNSVDHFVRDQPHDSIIKLQAPLMVASSIPRFTKDTQRRPPINPHHIVHEYSICQGNSPIDESVVSLGGESTFVYFNGREIDSNKKAKAVKLSPQKSLQERYSDDTLDNRSESLKLEVPTTVKAFRSGPNRNQSFKQLAVMNVSPVQNPAKLEDIDTESEDELHDFAVAVIQSSPFNKRSQRLVSSPRSPSRQSGARSHRYTQLPAALTPSSPSKQHGKWRLESVGTNDVSDSDDDLDASLNGEQLEALFQRNLRRHEILLGFQSKVHAQTQDPTQKRDGELPQAKSAWTELHRQLENNRRTSIRSQRRRLSTTSTISSNSSNDQKMDDDDEAALVASSQWMPSPLFLPEHATRTRSFTRNKYMPGHSGY